ncbi:hypothetical protein ACXX9E_28575 [Pseudomonas sp. GNP014]
MLKTNQNGRFRPPGPRGYSPQAAWSSSAKNGAKAVNWEATKRRVDASSSPTQRDRGWNSSDYWVEYQGR